MVAINLINQQRQQTLRRQQLGVRMTYASGAILAVMIAVAMGMILLKVSTQNQLADTEKQITQTQAKIDTHTTLISRHNLVQERLQLVQSLLVERTGYVSKLALFDDLYVNGGTASINQFGFGGDISNNQLQITGTSENLYGYDVFTKLLRAQVEPYSFSQILLTSLSINANKQLSFNYQVTLAKTKSD